ncbi:MAG TPA: hypothetical protein VLN56_10405, partial [Gammaproteobacteria bacterium]|nr:hypothetical protein [Gammaproteobacteria bacterium]
MERIEKILGHWVLKYRWVIILASLSLVGIAAIGTKNLYFTTNYRVFFSEDNPQLMAFETLEKTYTQNDNLLFVFVPADGKVFTRKTLKAISDFTEKAWQIPYSTRVDSITNFQHTEADGDELIVSDLVSDIDSLTESDLRSIRKIALEEPILRDKLISGDADVTAVNVTV